MLQRRRCRMDGGTCHHYCELGECFRERTCSPFDKPYDGYPQTGKYEAKVEALRVVCIEWSGAIFDTAEDARKWGQKIKRQWVEDGSDPVGIKVEVCKTDRDDSVKAKSA